MSLCCSWILLTVVRSIGTNAKFPQDSNCIRHVGERASLLNFIQISELALISSNHSQANFFDQRDDVSRGLFLIPSTLQVLLQVVALVSALMLRQPTREILGLGSSIIK